MVSEVVDTVSVYDPMEGLVTASSSALTWSPAAIESPPNRSHVATVALELKQFPTTLLAVISVRLEGPTIPRVVVPAGNVIVTWLFAAADKPPNADVVKPTV